MIGARAIILITSMALLCIVGLIGMLVADSAWDFCFFLLTILPLLFGSIVLWRKSSSL